MLRRVFLLGIAGFILNPIQKPAYAFIWLFRAAAVGVRLLRGVRVASRVSRAYRTGISTTARRSYASGAIRSSNPRPTIRRDPRVPTKSISRSEKNRVNRSIQRDVENFDNDLSRSDKVQLAKNIWKLAEKISDIMDLRDAIHLVDQWAEDHDWDVVGARLHIADCRTCNKAYMTLKRGTDIEMIPITNKGNSYNASPGNFSGEVTVQAEGLGLQPLRELSLPQIPTGMKSLVSGKQVTVRAQVSRNGRASVVDVDAPGLSEFIAKRAKEMVENTTWEPARNTAGRPVEGYVNVIFRWPS